MNKFLLLCLPVFFCMACPFIGNGQVGFSNTHRQVQQLYKDRLFSGIVLVAKRGKIVFQHNAGYSDREHQIPVSSDTRFELASISKTFTAILTLQLVEKGKLKLNDKVAKYIPEFNRNDSGDITIHHLLSHTSGIQDFVGLNCDFASWSTKEYLEGLQKTPINFKAGSQFQYASSTYILLRLIIERVSGQSYESNLKKYILDVAGMKNSGVIHNQEILQRRALGYISTEKGFKNALPVANHEIFIGASSIYSTVQDLLKFDQALYTNKLLGPEEKELMFTVVQPPYGYGWFINDDAVNGKTVAHGGDIFGFTTLIERRLKDRTLIIILGNLQSIDRDLIMKKIAPTLK